MKYDENDFCIFILSHGRPESVKTVKTILDAGYTGRWYVVVDNEDKKVDSYIKRYGEKCIVFDKLAISQKFDTADNFTDRRTVVYARNACFEIASEIGVTYFLELDDDYTGFFYRYSKGDKLLSKKISNLDDVIGATLEYYKQTNALSIAFAQGGDFIGGKNSQRYKHGILRKAMNTFFCSTERPFRFLGRINEDVNTYACLGQRGKLFLTITDVMVNQVQTQKNAGGMTDIYMDNGTYLKSFYTVMYCPSCTTIRLMGDKHKRLHHNVDWDKCVPRILSENMRRGACRGEV